MYLKFRCIFFAFIMPEIGAFLRSLKIVLVKTVHSPMPFDFFLVFIMETLHVTGVAILFYCALPYMDSVRAVMSAR
jgi:chitin synthase